MTVLLKNNVSSTLATAIAPSDTGLVVADGSRFPTITAGDYFYVTLVSQAGQTEIVKVTARVGNSMTVARAQDGSLAASFQVGTLVDMRVNVASIAELRNEAGEITIADAGGYYTSGTVEGALQEAAVYNQGGTNAVTRTVRSRLQDFVSVKDFGAVGDGVADDIVAINAAFAYAKATPLVKSIVFPSGNYRITGSINAKGNFNRGLRIIGLKATITATGNFPALQVNGRVPDTPPEVRMHHIIEGLVIFGPVKFGVGNTASVGIEVARGANVKIRDCHIYNFYRGLYLYGNLISSYENLYIYGNQIGIDAAYDGEFAPNDIHFSNCQVVDNIQAIKVVGNPNGSMYFSGCEIEGNNLAGNTTDGVKVVEFSNAGKITFTSCHFEVNPGQYNIYFDGPLKGHLNMIGCEVIPGDDCANAIFMDNISGLPNLFFVGGRATVNDTGLGQKSINLSTGVSAVVIGEFAGQLHGDLSKTTVMRSGQIGTDGRVQASTAIRAIGPSNIGIAVGGQLQFIDPTTSARLTYMIADGIRKDANSIFSIGASKSDIVLRRLSTDTVEAGEDNTYNLGTGGIRWKEIFSVNGTINTSDAREKQDIVELSEAERRVAVKLKGLVRRFRFKDAVLQKGDDSRYHVGVVAQDVVSAFESEGLDSARYGLLCFDEWEDYHQDILDEEGNPTGEQKLVVSAGSRFGIRYEQLLAFIIAAI
jgi:hypothetical protein